MGGNYSKVPIERQTRNSSSRATGTSATSVAVQLLARFNGDTGGRKIIFDIHSDFIYVVCGDNAPFGEGVFVYVSGTTDSVR